MAKARYDEILGPALDTDTSIVPRYDIVAADGSILYENVTLQLKNPISVRGTTVDKRTLDECLAASGVTNGNNTAFTLVQENFALFDGAPVRFCLHMPSGEAATLNVNNTGAKPLRLSNDRVFPAGVSAQTWVSAVYSAPLGAYVVQSAVSVPAQFSLVLPAANWTDEKQVISHPQLLLGNYAYTVAPDDYSYGEYALCNVRALELVTAGQITFVCEGLPLKDLIVYVRREEVLDV